MTKRLAPAFGGQETGHDVGHEPLVTGHRFHAAVVRHDAVQQVKGQLLSFAGGGGYTNNNNNQYAQL